MRRRILVAAAVVVVAALATGAVVAALLLDPYWVANVSMEPTLDRGDRVMAAPASGGGLRRGDVVVYTAAGERRARIGRVVAVGGDRIEGSAGTVTLNGRPLAEPYLRAGTTTEGLVLFDVPAGSVFVLGDNRPFSRDSRALGAIRAADVLGRVVFRYWPLPAAGRV